MNLGDIVEVHCDLEGQPVNHPDNYSFTVKRNFKVIGKDTSKDLYLLQLHHASPFGIQGSRMDLKNFELLSSLDSTELPLIKIFPVSSRAFVTTQKVEESGCSCLHCKDFYPYAAKNRKDGKFLCYSCRSSVSSKYPDLTP
jgi:hypothetical protein